jgi:hypothetical protein
MSISIQSEVLTMQNSAKKQNTGLMREFPFCHAAGRRYLIRKAREGRSLRGRLRAEEQSSPARVPSL